MDFGIAIPSAANSWKIAARAEALGFTHAWFYDTQMLCADPFVAMAATAMHTTRIRLGTGVLVPSNRIAPVTAAAFASLNALAPGRIDFGVGTGFTARRAMGFGAMTLTATETYIHQVMGLLANETVAFAMAGETHPIRFLNPELGLINTQDKVALHVSAYGPRARALTARLGAGWLNFIGVPRSGTTELAEMQAAWSAAGRDGTLHATAFALGCILEPGETFDSPRALAEAGPRAAVLLHRAADEALAGLPNSSKVPDAVAAEVAGYVARARDFAPADARYLENHRGHLLFVKPAERPFVTAELIRQTTFTGTETELRDRIGDLRDAGYTQFAIQVVPGHEQALEGWGRIRAAFL